MCSPTATRSSVRSPSRSPTAIRLKSVVPPPTSQTQHEIADLDAAPPAVPERVEPGVERRLRLFEQRHLFEPGGAGGAQRELARFFVERRRHGQEHVLMRQRQRRIAPAAQRIERRAQCFRYAARHRPATLSRRRRARPTAGIGAVRFAAPCDSHDFADATRRVAFSAPRLRASSPTT
jgi:hypothetical protein